VDVDDFDIDFEDEFAIIKIEKVKNNKSICKKVKNNKSIYKKCSKEREKSYEEVNYNFQRFFKSGSLTVLDPMCWDIILVFFWAILIIKYISYILLL